MIFLLQKITHAQATLSKTSCQIAIPWRRFVLKQTWHTPATVWSKLLERVLKIKYMNKWIRLPIISKFSYEVQCYSQTRFMVFCREVYQKENSVYETIKDWTIHNCCCKYNMHFVLSILYSVSAFTWCCCFSAYIYCLCQHLQLKDQTNTELWDAVMVSLLALVLQGWS